MTRKCDIFISYKRNDKEKVFAVKDYIERHVGVNCWIDLDGIESDAQFANVIIKAIKNAQVFLFMYSASHAQIDDFDCDWTIREINFAQKQKKRIVFINIDGTPLTDWFEFTFGTKQQIDANSDSAKTKLCNDLKKWIKVEEHAVGSSISVKQPRSPTLAKSCVNGDKFVVDLDGIKFNMIRVEGGEMMIGATDEQIDDAEKNEHPAHTVTVPTFYIGQFPVTQNIWELVMGYNNSKNRAEGQSKDKISSAVAGAVIGTLISGPIGALVGGIAGCFANIKIEDMDDAAGHYPVESISFDEAKEFVRRLSQLTNIQFSLPTEEEWEYAARGGRKSKGYKYAGSNDIGEVAWFRGNADGTTHPVGVKKPNELELYDMSGNVWEWTDTLAHSYSMNVEPQGTVYIRRGGSWWQEAKNCRISRRYPADRSKKTSGLGLRVVIRENVGQK